MIRPKEIQNRVGTVVIEESVEQPGPTIQPVLLVQKLDEPKKQPPPIIDFDPPNPQPGKDKKPPIPTPPTAEVPSPETAGTLGPRPLIPFGSRQVRLPLLGDPAIAAQGAVAPATGVALKHFNKYVHELVDPSNTLDLIQGRSRLLVLKATPKRIQVASSAIITATSDGKEVSIVGNQVGATVLNVWIASAEDKTKEVVLSYLVRVAPDPDAKNRLERAYQALEGEINQTFPGSKVQLKFVGDAVVILGQAADRRDADSILRLVSANTPGGEAAKVFNMLRVAGEPSSVETNLTGEPAIKKLEAEINRVFPESQIQLQPIGDLVLVSGQAPHRREAGQILRVVATRVGGDKNCRVIDKLRFSGVEQVMLKVVVCEVNRTAAQRANVCLDLSQRTVCMDKGQAAHAMSTLKRSNCAKILAEPALVTLDGQIARFDAGGLVVFASNGNTSAPVPYGVQLAFTPTVLDRGRVRLEVSASLSARDGASSHASLLNLTSRGFSSTVEMNEGQTLTVAGLLQTITGNNRSHFPMWRNTTEEQELVILITPELMVPAAFSEQP